jgi:O-antigen/teichoic acid export membrane protein
MKETALASGPVPRLKPARSGAVRGEQLPATRRKFGLWAYLLATLSGKDTLAVIDQAVVSGTSFLTTVLIGRWCGAGQLGVYSLGFTLLVTWACVQESLIALPYTIHRHRPLPETQAEYAGSALVHQGFLSALALITLAACGVVPSLEAAVPGLSAVIWALAGVVPFVLLREFGRRFAFAHLRMAEALVLDVAVAVVQLAGLAWLASTGTLSARTSYVPVGVACALTGAVWLYLARGNFAIRWEQVRRTMQQNWSLGKWLFASQVTLLVQGYFIHWLLAWVVGSTATGVYAACMTVVLFSNPLILGISNALAPRTAQAFHEGGGTALRRVVFQTTLLLGMTMAWFCVVVLLFGEDILSLLYSGNQYEGHGHAVTILALAMLASALGMPASNGLAAVERPEVIFKIGLVAVGLSVFLGPWLVDSWGVVGAAYGFLAGNVAGSVGRWMAFSALIPRRDLRSLSATVKGVLRQCTQSSHEHGWVIEPLNEGAQASLFSVRTQDGQPAWIGRIGNPSYVRTYSNLVVKLYKPAVRERAELGDVVRDQFESMAQLHAKLDGSTINGWKIHVPVPLYQSDCVAQPGALVMTLVPGTSLTSCLETAGAMTAETLESIADAIITVMERCWSIESQIHGDFNFDNILCDLDGRSLALVDPGVGENVVLCHGVTKQWSPASCDLAHLLYETEVGVKRTLANPGARQRQRCLAEQVLRAFLKRIDPAEKHGLLDEIHACAQIYLNSLQASWTPRGLWRAFVRQLATRRIDEILSQLRTEIGASR